MFNARTFANFTPAQRKALLEVIPKSLVNGTTLHLDGAAKARKLAKERGVTFWQADDDFKARAAEFRKNEVANLISDMRKRGVADPEKPINTHLANIDKWQKKFDEWAAIPTS